MTEVLKMDAGELIPAVRGKVIRVGKYFSGETDKGPWSFQTIVVDEGGTKMDFKVKGRDELPARGNVGKVMFVVAKNSDKGLSGIKAEDDSYGVKEGQPLKRIVLITPSAEITFGVGDWSGTEGKANQAQNPPQRQESRRAERYPDDGPGDGPDPDGPLTDPAPAMEQAQQAQAPAATTTPARAGSEWDDLKVDVNRIRKLHLLCCAAACRNVCELTRNSVSVGEEFYQATVAMIFIEACKRGAVGQIPAVGEPPVTFQVTI